LLYHSGKPNAAIELKGLEGTTLAKRDPIRQLVIEMARCVSDDKCSDAAVLDLQGISSVTDYFLIATGTSDRQLRSVADHLKALAKEKKILPLGYDGYDSASWILIDFGSIVVHLFAPSYRELYDLELLWGDAPKVRWQRRATTKKTTAETEETEET
jgi:ribosome-associated protein